MRVVNSSKPHPERATYKKKKKNKPKSDFS